MVQAVREQYRGEHMPEAICSRWRRKGSPRARTSASWSSAIPARATPRSTSCGTRLLELGQRPEVKFLVVSSDVIYPAGAMKDYEPKFYLPFKGFTKPIYAVPGNHDWYDALEAFTANFLEPEAARAALRARRARTTG